MNGNNCGHIPDKPRWFNPPEKHANRPGILRRIIQSIRNYYARPAEILPGLNSANESDRQQRSERREACVAVLACILHYTDLITLRVGIPQPDGGMAGLTMPFLAELSSLGERRAERAVADLKKAGIITVHPLCERLVDATYKGYAAIRTVTKNLFTVLGLSAWLEHERRKAQERQNKRTEKKRRKELANVQMTMNAQLGPASKTKPESTAGEGTDTSKLKPMTGYFANLRAALIGGTDPP
jgi:hypothetical protein